MRAALLTNYTDRGLGEALQQAALSVGVQLDLYRSPYRQYTQDILSSSSTLYAHDPQVIILFLDTRILLGDTYWVPYSRNAEQWREWKEETVEMFSSLIDHLRQHSKAKIVLHNLEVPVFSPRGQLESKQSFGFHRAVRAVNEQLAALFIDDHQLFVFDYDAFCSDVGKKHICDPKLYYLGDIRLRQEAMTQLAAAYLTFVRPIASMTKKCLVLDLDRTLWGGVVGEDGLQGIQLGPTPQGRSFLEFQQYIFSLFQHGVILAINSRNNEQDAMRVLREHPYAVLREEHFAAMRINWEDKAANMRSLAEEINIGLDSMVFIDDDPVNRGWIRSQLPEVTVPEWPHDSSQYVETLARASWFSTLSLTEEDVKKGVIYAAEKQRRILRSSMSDIHTYLCQLQMIITIREATTETIPRIAQLTQKTNQFTTTSRRYSQEELEAIVSRSDSLVVSLQVEDRFGDNGLVGAAIMHEDEDGVWVIESLQLSCRVIGRRIEEAFLAVLVACVQARKGHILIGEVIDTEKNAPARDLYQVHGWLPTTQKDAIKRWSWDVSHVFKCPDLYTVDVPESISIHVSNVSEQVILPATI